MNYLKIYIKYHFNIQYRIYRSNKNRFDWFTNIIFYEYRKDIKLFSAHRFPKFELFKIEIIIITLKNIQNFYDFNDNKNEYNFNNDND